VSTEPEVPRFIVPELAAETLAELVREINRPTPVIIEVPKVMKSPEDNAVVANAVGSLFKSNWQDYITETNSRIIDEMGVPKELME
jgi:capsular polysaccharide biosynthesis protein